MSYVIRSAVSALILAVGCIAQIPVEIISTAKASTRADWCTVAVPASMVPDGVRAGRLEKRAWPVVVGRRLGDHSVLLQVYCAAAGPQTRIADRVVLDQAEAPKFELDQWAEADDLVPWPEVIVRNKPGSQRAFRHLIPLSRPAAIERQVVHQGAAERVTRFRVRLTEADGAATPLFWRAYLYQRSGSNNFANAFA